MSKETAKKLIAELLENEELRTRIADVTGTDELVKKAAEAGYDVTLEEMLEAEREYKSKIMSKTDELTTDELEAAAGGGLWEDEYSRDGKEFGCAVCNLHYEDQQKLQEWCRKDFFCSAINNAPPCERTPHNYGPKH